MQSIHCWHFLWAKTQHQAKPSRWGPQRNTNWKPGGLSNTKSAMGTVIQEPWGRSSPQKVSPPWVLHRAPTSLLRTSYIVMHLLHLEIDTMKQILKTPKKIMSCLLHTCPMVPGNVEHPYRQNQLVTSRPHTLGQAWHSQDHAKTGKGEGAWSVSWSACLIWECLWVQLPTPQNKMIYWGVY